MPQSRLKRADSRRASARSNRRSRILIVCQGNTCRSPMAEAIARRILGVQAQIQSAGLDAADGLPATRQAVTAMEELGFDIKDHRSRSLDSLDLSSFDRIIAMTPEIADSLRDAGVSPRRLTPLDVSDPYSGSLDTYRSTARDIERQLRSRLRLRRVHAN